MHCCIITRGLDFGRFSKYDQQDASGRPGDAPCGRAGRKIVPGRSFASLRIQNGNAFASTRTLFPVAFLPGVVSTAEFSEHDEESWSEEEEIRRGARREGEFGGGHENVEHDKGGPPHDSSNMNDARLFFTVVDES